MLISLENINFGYRGEALLENISLTVHEKDRIGLIGGNGEGKTTLLKLMLGQLVPYSGTVFTKKDITVGYLEQIGDYDSPRTVYDEMRSVFAETEALIEAQRETEKKIAALPSHTGTEYRELSEKYERLERKIAACDGYGYEVHIRTVLNGMGFGNAYGRPIRSLSGGEKTKIKFCRLLLENPDLLILDEPTNHLDVKTLFWLEDYLAQYKGALLLVSHDRYFLDRTVTKIAELECRTLEEYRGNYSKYKTLKAERQAAQQKEYDKQQEEIAHMQDYVDRNLVRATTTKMAQSRRTALEKMEIVEKPRRAVPPPRFRFTYGEKPYESVLRVDSLTLTAGEKTLFRNGSFSISRGEKCALIGDNSVGKSTLLRAVVADSRREISLGRLVRIAYYDQENSNLSPNNTVLEEMWGRHVLSSQTDVRAALARAGLHAEDMEKTVMSLSGGERAKLSLAVLEAEHGNFLILDEPTNHLDLPARESLEEALRAFDGTLLFVSHDRYFISAIADKVVKITQGGITEFKGSYESFLETEKTPQQQQPGSDIPRPVQSAAANPEYHRGKQARAEDAKKRQRIRELETRITEAEEEQESLSAEIASPEVLADYRLMKEKCERLETLKAETDALYEEYALLTD